MNKDDGSKADAVAARPASPCEEARRASQRAAPGWARYFLRSGWAHLLLLTGTGIFLCPFAWMIVTSLKTDEELQEGGWWPAIPVMREVSPYARPPVVILQPSYVSDAAWSAAVPELKRRADAAVGAALGGEGLTWDDADLREAAASQLLNQLAPRLRKSDWQLAKAELSAAFAALLTPETVAAAIEDRAASVDLLGVQIRTLDASIHNVFSTEEFATQWKAEGDGQIRRRGNTSFLRYKFDRPTGRVVLRGEFEFPADPAELHKLILTLRPDNSWHRLDAALEVGGWRWTSQRPTYLAQHRAMSVIFQPPGFDDSTLQPKTWVPMKKEGLGNAPAKTPSSVASSPASGPRGLNPPSRRATLTLTISPSSTASATWAKVSRNYVRAFYAVPFWRYLANSLLLVVLTTVGMLFSSTFVAYAFARLHWPGRGAALVILLSTMMLPAQVTFIPQFLIWRQLGWYNTLNPLWVPAFAGGAFFIFLMTQHMKTLPRELEESARIDGLNAVQTWYYIILPQVKPAAAAIAIMTFMWSWNEFLGPLIYLRDQAKFPLSLGLFAMRLENFGDWSLIMAGNVLMTLPVIVIFFFCQRYFIEGMSMSGMKG